MSAGRDAAAGGAVTPASADHAWERSLGLWVRASWAVIGLSTLVAVGESWSTDRLLPAIAVGATFGGWFALMGVPAMRGRRGARSAAVFLLGMILLQAAAIAVSPAYLLLSFATYSLCFVLLHPLAVAVVVVAVLSVVVGLSTLWWDGTLPTALVQAALTFMGAAAVGVFISRIIDESARRAELIAALETMRSELTAAHRESGIAAERARLAGEIHDTLAQGFTSLLALIRAAQVRVMTDPDETGRLLRVAEETAAENLDEARSLVAALQPSALRSGSLVEALGRLARRTADESGVDIELLITGDERQLTPAEEVVILRAGQEALANVRKHAAARSVVLALDYGAPTTLTVADDGMGFDPSAPKPPDAGFGLRGMRRRLDEAGGALDVVSRPGGGTTVTVTLP